MSLIQQCMFVYRRRQWHPTPVLLPGKSYGLRSLVGYRPWGHKESDMTERLHFTFTLHSLEGLMLKPKTPILWPPDAKNWLIGKDPDVGKDWRQEEKGMTEGEMVGWHHWHDGRESGWTLGIGDGQGGLGCCGPWCRKESDTTERLNWTQKGGKQKSQ